MILALELLCDEAVCLMKSTNCVRLIITISSKVRKKSCEVCWKNSHVFPKTWEIFFNSSYVFAEVLQYSFLQQLLRGFYIGIKCKALRLK